MMRATALIVAILAFPMAGAQRTDDVPAFAVDRTWPRPLPNNWAVGPVSGIATDARDHIWIIHRGETVKEAGGVPAPPVIEFDAAGAIVQTWGGPGNGYEWPQQVHGITVDAKDRVWISGNGERDAHILAFTRAGKFIRQIGHSGKSGGSNDTANLARATQMRLDVRTNEIYVSDGEQNQNHRVIVFDSETGAYKRHWGAYGARPDDVAAAAPVDPAGPPPKQFGSAVHCVRFDRDGLVYVCDRSNSRFQIFRKDGGFVREVFVAKASQGAGTVYDLDFSPDQQFIYVADGANQKVWILRRDGLSVVGSFGERGQGTGQFATSLHDLTVDSRGNVYTGEAAAGGRVQKFAVKVSAQASIRDGNEEWQRIRKSAPYEWEGDIEAIAEWTLGNYVGFLEKYPNHPLAAEAMLKIATAIWAQGGYPELFHYVIAPTWEEHAAKERHLSQWFETTGFGGGLGQPVKQQPEAAARAREMFVALAMKYPSSKSAEIARYYSAVILDYCLSDGAGAVAEYRAFVQKYPAAGPYLGKAKRRIATLSR